MKQVRSEYFCIWIFLWNFAVNNGLPFHRSIRSTEDPYIILYKKFSNPQQVNDKVVKFNVEVTVQQKTTAPLTLYDVRLRDWCININTSNRTARITTNNVEIIYNMDETDNFLTVNISLVQGNSILKVTYNAETKNYENFKSNVPTYYPIYITYSKGISGSSVTNSLSNNESCITRIDDKQTTTNVGLIIGLIIIGFILGIGIVVLILFIYIKCARNGVKKKSSSSTLKDDKSKLKDAKMKLILSKKEKDGSSNHQHIREGKCDESLVQILTINDAIEVYQSIDELDVYCSTEREQEMENIFDKLLVEANIILIKYLQNYNTIEENSSNEEIEKYKSQIKMIDAENADKLKKANSKLLKKLYFKNKSELEHFLKRCREEKDAFTQQLNTRHCPKNILDQLLSLIDQQHDFERNDLIYRLKLEQEEEIEKLRKSFSLNKRNQCRELGNNFIKAVVSTHSLKEEQANWLLKEQKRIQQHLIELFDEELARQRMSLDEILETRRMLAKVKQLEDDNSVEMFNTLAGQQLSCVQKCKRNGMLTPEQFDFYTKEIQDVMLTAKNKLHEERSQKERELCAELSQRKKEVLSEKRRLNKEELKHFVGSMSELANNSDSMLDPTNYLEKQIEIRVRQQRETDALHLEQDEAHVIELLKQFSQANTQTEGVIEDFKSKLLVNLQHEGLSESEVEKMLKQHRKEVDDLHKMQKEDEEAQRKNLQKKLAQRRKQFEADQNQEAEDQRVIRNHDVQIINNLLDKQVTINDEERELILKEHAKNMSNLENSLTLARLRKKVLLNGILAQRRAKKVERLQAKQMVEVQNQAKSKRRRVVEEDTDDEDGRTQEQMELFRKHIEQQLTCQQNEYMELESETESVRQKLLSERIDAMTAQEERLASQISLLQIEKAKELARIEEQKVTLGQLKMNLLQDLNDRGYLSDDKCRAILSDHNRHQEVLQRKLEEERIAKEKILKERLQQRMMRQEEQLLMGKKQELEQEMQRLNKKERAIFEMKSIVLEDKQLVELEKFRNRIERECNQTLHEMRREFDLYKQRQLEEEEMKFVSGLVRLGLFTRAELLDVLRVLFPLKSTEQLEQLFINKLCSQDAESKRVKEPVDSSNKSNLLENTKLMRNAINGLPNSKINLQKERKQRPSSQGQMKSIPLNSNLRREITPIDRPDPITARDSPQYAMSNLAEYGQTRGTTLPPLESRNGNLRRFDSRQKIATQVRPSVEYDYEV